jgi:hypothetical protein
MNDQKHHMKNKRKDQRKVQKHSACKRTNKEKELIPFGVGSRKYVPLDIRGAVGEIAS